MRFRTSAWRQAHWPGLRSVIEENTDSIPFEPDAVVALALPAHDARSIPVLHYGNGCRTRSCDRRSLKEASDWAETPPYNPKTNSNETIILYIVTIFLNQSELPGYTIRTETPPGQR